MSLKMIKSISPKNYLIAMDSFKGSLSSIDAANAVKAGILNANPDAEVVVSPLADGGEGTVNALTYGMNGNLQSAVVTDPYGNSISCEYGIAEISISNESKVAKARLCAIIEVAGACGLYLVPEAGRNPLYTSTYGVGEVITDALNKGCRSFIIGIGGTSTNDGGIGMLSALGIRFLDNDGNEVPRGAIGLKNLHNIDLSGMDSRLKDCTIMVACDVDNPLCGARGCSRVFAPQKGADSGSVEQMDRWLSRYGDMTEDLLGRSTEGTALKDSPGTGAAGGLGFAFKTYLSAELKSGIDIVINETGLKDKIKNADVIITGEGCLDFQTAMGKAPIGVAKAVKSIDPAKRIVAFAGRIGDGAGECLKHGIDEYYGVTDIVSYNDPADYMKHENAFRNLTKLAERFVREQGH